MDPEIAARDAVDAVRQLADPRPPWNDILRSAQRLIGADSASFILFDSGQVAALEQVNIQAAAQDEYERHFHSQDIFMRRGLSRPVGTWLDSEEVLPLRERHRNAYYVDFMLRHRLRHMLAFVIEDGPTRSAAFTVQRESVLPDARSHLQSTRVQAYVRELQKALARRRQAALHWQETIDTAFQTFGEAACLVSLRGSLLWNSQNFEQMMGEPAVLRLRQHQLQHPDPRVDQAFRAALVRAGIERSPVHLALPAATGPGLGLEMVPAQPILGFGSESCVLVRMRRLQAKSQPSPDALAMVFGLSAAESRVLAALAGGQAPGDYASARGLSVHTVRKHIANLMGKMNCSRHADAIRMALATGQG